MPKYFSQNGKFENKSALLAPNITDQTSLYSTNKEANKYLVKQIKKLNDVSKEKLNMNTDLPDVVNLINDVDVERGISMNTQINNILLSIYHRNSGYSLIEQAERLPKNIPKPTPPKPDQADADDDGNSTKKSDIEYREVLSQNEGYVATINLFNNFYLNQRLGVEANQNPKIIQFVSPTIEKLNLEGIINTVITLIAVNLFPIALSLGFPLMLYVLVMEKENKIKSLLDFNGLDPKNYWISVIIYYFLLFTFITTIFQAFGFIFLDMAFFKKTNIILLQIFFTGWNIG